MLRREFVDPQPAYVHPHGTGRRQLSPYEPHGEIIYRGALISVIDLSPHSDGDDPEPFSVNEVWFYLTLWPVAPFKLM